MVRHLDLVSYSDSFNHIPLLIFYDAHVNSTKYTGLVSFCHSLDLFVFACRQSTPESWAQFSHDNIVGTEHERMASVQLRALVDNVLIDISRDIKEQADAVDMALRRRIEELLETKAKLEENLKRVWICHGHGRSLSGVRGR